MAAASPVPGDPRVVYFGRLDREVSDAEFEATAGRAGATTNVDRRRGFAYVTYSTVAEADKAVAELNGLKLNTREIVVEKSKSLEDRPPREARPPRAPRADPVAAEGDAAVRLNDKRIVVRNLPRTFEAEKLASYFSTFGTVTKTRMAAGLGRVAFETEAAAAAALANPSHTIDGVATTIEKERARPRRPRKARGAAAAATGAGAAAPAGGRAAGGRGGRAAGGAGASTTDGTALTPRQPRRLRVEGLVTGMTAEQLKNLFQTIAPIASAKIPGEAQVGFVTFETPEGAQQALKLHGTTVSGHTLSITVDSSRRRRTTRRRSGSKEGGAPFPPRDPSELVNTVWVTGLSREKTEEGHLRSLFGRFGAIQSVTVLGDRRQSAYIKYESAGAVASAITEFNGKSVEGAEKPLKVEAATGKSTRRPRGAAAAGATA